MADQSEKSWEVEEEVFVEEPVKTRSSKEVDLESQRMDETSSLATDRYDNEGNRVV